MSFRIHESVKRIGDILRIDGRTLVQVSSPGDVDPEAILFVAIAGRLTEHAKLCRPRKGSGRLATVYLPTTP